MEIKIYKSWKEYKSHLLTKWFTEWIDNEFDLELLSMTKGMITTRETDIKTVLDKLSHKEIKGFRI